jgi:hypothetical protein
MTTDDLPAPDLLELCHANSCTCETVEAWDHGGPDPDDSDPLPSDWFHDDDCPLAMDIGLVLAVNGIDPDDHCVAYSVLNALEVDTLEAIEGQRRMWQLHRQAHPEPGRIGVLDLALLDWREHRIRDGHHWSFPAKPTGSACRGQLHRYADTPRHRASAVRGAGMGAARS